MALTAQEFYQAANLTENPFRSNPTQESDPRMDIWVGYEKEKQQLWKFLNRSRSDQIGNSNLVLLYGDYGTGKSHALLWARHQILDAKKTEFNSVCYYIQTLRKDGKISFAGAFKEDIVGKSSIVIDVLSYKQFLEECVIQYKKDNGLGPETSKESIVEKLLNSVEHFNFARDILRCESQAQVSSLLIPAKFGDYQAMTTISKLINLFVYEIKLSNETRRFRNGAYIFIDEIDLLATATAKEARDTNELFRHLYDNCPNCFCMVLSFTATAAELNILFAPYILSRISKQITMNLLALDEAKIFVREILDSARYDPKGPKEYFPFEESAVHSIVSQIVSITPRKIINAMQQVLEEIRLLKFDPSKKKVDETFLDDNGVLEDVLGS